MRSGAESSGGCGAVGTSLTVWISGAGTTGDGDAEAITWLAGSLGTDVTGDVGASSLGLGPDVPSAAFVSGCPHSGQNSAPSRKEAPQAKHRREISGCTIRISDCDFGLRTANQKLRIDYQQSWRVFKSEIRNPKSLNPMHRMKQVFALGINAHAKFLPLGAKTFFQLGC